MFVTNLAASLSLLCDLAFGPAEFAFGPEEDEELADLPIMIPTRSGILIAMLFDVRFAREEIVERVTSIFKREPSETPEDQSESEATHMSRPVSEDASCSICWEGHEESHSWISLPCGHAFHDACLRKWLAQQRTCPMCRSEPRFVRHGSH
ncbi:unnamed protein product [Durusdinium trenchii]|uniref:RING-type E3 ubiquitin transferase n=1 Tax=Durusdinium trenchii TaxID=1381693 RepID=A0ABP0HLF6_9DINO